MNTNRTIDGVPRALRPVLAMILNALDRDAADGKAVRGEMAEELRALLDAPVAFQTPDCPDCACVQDGQCLCIPSKPAAQPQSDPVAIVNEGDDGLFIEFIYGENGNPLQRGDMLYAKQSAPVEWVPTVAQIRHRRPERNCPNWGPWNDLKVEIYDENRTNYIDTTGWECETRLLYIGVTKT